MELKSSSLSLIFTFLLSVFIVLKIRKRPRSTPNLPPGPWKLPIIGNLHQMVGALPHRTLGDLAKKYGPLMHLRLGEVSIIVVSSAELAEEVMKTQDLVFSTRPEIIAAKIMSYGNRGIAFAPYGDYWRQLRKICTLELLNAKRVQSFWSIREEEMLKLIKWLDSNAGSSINLTQKIFSSTYGITSRAAFGKKRTEQDRFIQVMSQAIELAAGFDISDVFPSFSLIHVISGTRPKLERLQQETDRILENIITEHRRKRVDKEDLVDVLLKFENNDNFDFSLGTDNIKAIILVCALSPPPQLTSRLFHKQK